MKKTALKDLACQRGGLARIARIFNIQPSAVQKAVNAGRDITIIEYDDGTYEGVETRQFPQPKKTR